MAIILNIETATEIGSVCLSKGEKVLSFKEGTTTFSHAEETTLMIEATMKEAGFKLSDLDAIAVSSGPGSYTSLRIGTSVAKGICYALDIPLIAISTLKSLAFAATKMEKGDLYIPMIDARRMEVYTSFYDEQLNCQSPMHPMILDEKSFETELNAQKRLVFAGNGATKVKKVIDNSQLIFTGIVCKATNLVPLAYQAYLAKQFEDVAYFVPNYLKPPNITTPKKVL